MERFVSLAALVATVSEARCPAAPRPVTSVKVTVRPAPPARTAAEAEAFLDALIDAGRRPNANGVRVFAGSDCQKLDEENLLRAFCCGYSKGQAHGTQVDNARAMAKRIAKPVAPATKPYSRGTSATVTGYVAGVNDSESALAKQNGAIEGQIRVAIDEARDAMSREDWATVERIEREINVLRSKLTA